jgi:type 2 lantibiotic biosynthesis protein LanM
MHTAVPSFPWQRATFLHERALVEAPPSGGEEEASLQEAERRAQAWRQLMSGDEKAFEERLHGVGLDRQAFLRILTRAGSPPGEPTSHDTWVAILQAILTQQHAQESLPAALQAPTQPGQPGLPFSGFLHPFLRLGAARLRARLPESLRPEIESTLLENLARKLQTLATRVLILELNVARMLEQLPGESPQERFHFFSTSWLQQPHVRAALLEEYPVLARLLATTVERWLETSLEFLEHLATDRPHLGAAFLGGEALGELIEMQGGVSDLHRGGRSVLLLRFSSGLRLVYKPKSLQVDVHFQQFLQWLNAEGLRHPHRVLTVVDRDDHGWVEFAEAAGCDSPEALRRFYWRQGSSLALLHLLSAVDFHLENLIAAGEYPVLVDLEALFHHRPPLPRSQSASDRAWTLLDRSLLSVGMLPMFLFGRGGRGGGIDMSGLGGEAGQLSPHAVPMLEDPGLDTMRVVRRQGLTTGSNNRPRLHGQPVDPIEYTDDIVQGFQETYQLLTRHREALAPRLRALANVEVRHIVRATQRYATLLLESHHPDFLREGLERDKVLDHLWAEAAVVPELRRVIPSEHADLRLGDIPLFTTRPGERHLYSSTGECIPDYFAQDSLGEVLERLARMDEKECATQVSFLRKSMVSLDKGSRAAARARGAQETRRQPEATLEACLAAAVGIGEQLAAQALHGTTDVCWIGMHLEDIAQWRWSLSPLGTDLYEGLGGMALFFGYLARVTGRGDFEKLARAALEPVRQAWREPATDSTGVGAFVGRGSTVYVLSHLATLWNEPALHAEVLAGLPALEPLIDADTHLDLLSGVAGCAVALLGEYQQTAEARLLEVAKRCGERLLATAVPCPGGGVGWKSPAGEVPLAGYSHGAAGIVQALLELASATGDKRYRDMARQALAHERSLFVPEQGNWRDLREAGKAPTDTPQAFMSTWCHGAPGIALGRLVSLRHLNEPTLRVEIETALATTQRAGFGGNHSLCHGDVGNLEVLALAGERLGEPRWTHAALRRAAEVLAQGQASGWRCGLPQGAETPGLMMGLAGIGYGLLRLAASDRVPSVLALAPAPRR